MRQSLNKDNIVKLYFDTIFVPSIIPKKKYSGTLQIYPIEERIVTFNVPTNIKNKTISHILLQKSNHESYSNNIPLYIRETRYKCRNIY